MPALAYLTGAVQELSDWPAKLLELIHTGALFQVTNPLDTSDFRLTNGSSETPNDNETP
jgi:hypothetical protein